MADSSDIDNAVLAKLGADATLLALVPNGVYWGEAPQNATQFVIVSLVDSLDVGQFRGRAYEDLLYAIEARMIEQPGVALGNIKSAAARIDVLLEGQPLTITGYTHMVTFRESRLRPPPEVDEADSRIRWHRRGGMYRVAASL